MEDASAKKIQAVDKAMRLLALMASNKAPMTLAEVSQSAGLPKSTAHGLLSTLREHGVVEQSNEDGRYRLGVRLFEWGCIVSNSWDIAALSRPYLQHITAATEESAFLSMLDGHEAVVIDHMQANGMVRIASESGTKLPLHCTSQGKILLAFQPRESVRFLLKPAGLKQYTPYTICDMDGLLKELDECVQRGYAIENGEYHVGLRAVSAPVRNVKGEVRYALSVVGMFRKIDSLAFSSATKLVCDVADQMSQALGYRKE